MSGFYPGTENSVAQRRKVNWSSTSY
jgi:hypothetical protein